MQRLELFTLKANAVMSSYMMSDFSGRTKEEGDILNDSTSTSMDHERETRGSHEEEEERGKGERLTNGEEQEESIPAAVSDESLVENILHLKEREEGKEEDNEIIDKANIFRKRKRRNNSMILNVQYDKLVSNELELKIALYNHICSPLKRWTVGRIIPYKMILQIIKTVLVLLQVFLFAYTLANDRAFFIIDAKEVMRQLLLKNKGTVNKLFTEQQVLDEIAFTVNQYYQLPNITLGGYGHQLLQNKDNSTNTSIHPILATMRQYRQANFDPSTGSVIFDYTIDTSNYNLTNDTFVMDQLTDEINWNSFIDLSLSIGMRNIHIVQRPDRIDCHHMTITILFSNIEHSGIITHSLQLTDIQRIDCNSQLQNHNKVRSTSLTVFRTVVDISLITICIISTIFAVIKYWRAFKLGKAMGEFYKEKLGIILSWRERKSLFSLWLLFSIISNVLLILASILKICLEFNVTSFGAINVRFLLGSAVLIEAGTILRYISFFRELNALPRTLRFALPDLLKFLLCTLILFFAFSICGSIIFAPYNERFSDFPNSLQSLYVLTNGDDIYPMFRSFDSADNSAVIVYAQIFIYVFVSLFVYAVLNLFTSLIIKAHEQSQSVNRATVNEVRKFVYSGPLTKNGKALCDNYQIHKWVDPEVIKNRSKSQTMI